MPKRAGGVTRGHPLYVAIIRILALVSNALLRLAVVVYACAGAVPGAGSAVLAAVACSISAVNTTVRLTVAGGLATHA
ncbi:MAG: hypothetical protein NTY73_02705 [Candidatus Micrarchaeota archaeon]|nr:hypothetical protein [Candidatus Micrarchaeota archaeon]